MTITSISGNSPTLVGTTSPISQKTQSSLWAQLGKDLNVGNLSGAQSAFATIKSNYEQSKAAGTAKTPPASISGDLVHLSHALQAGKLSEAQSVFAKLAQDAKAAGIVGGSEIGSSTSGSTSASTGVSASGSLSVLA